MHVMLFLMPGSWSLSPSGCPSVAGTTASIVICRGDHIFLAHVGDSTVVLAKKGRRTVVLTKDHKPEDPEEKKAIEERGETCINAMEIHPSVCLSPGGYVRNRKYAKVRQVRCGEERRQLRMSRSLGDFWSFNPVTRKYAISAKPDVSIRPINPWPEDLFLILASDGLWDVMSPEEAVKFIWDYKGTPDHGMVQALVSNAVMKWRGKRRTDNIAVVVIIFIRPKA